MNETANIFPSVNPIKVLDYGFARLVKYMGSDLDIVRSARVSFNAEWRAGEDEGKDEKLIAFLLKNKHTSPFESIAFTFEIKCPLFVRSQWHRHRTWAYSEVSARYTELDMGFYLPTHEQITTQSKDNKQAKTTELHPRADEFRNTMYVRNADAFDKYKEMLEAGCPRELARTILPVAAYTRFFGTVNLHNLMHFLDLRLHEHAQYEIRVYAEALKTLAALVVPVTMRCKYGS